MSLFSNRYSLKRIYILFLQTHLQPCALEDYLEPGKLYDSVAENNIVQYSLLEERTAQY